MFWFFLEQRKIKHGLSCKVVSKKNLKPGALLLGVVTHVDPQEVFVDLPNGVSAVCGLDDVNAAYTADEEDEDGLRSIYAVGEYVVCCVKANNKGKLRVTLDAETVWQFQEGEGGKREVGEMAMGTLVAVEDRGWRVKLAGGGEEAFIKMGDMGGQVMAQGKTVWGRVKKRGRPLQLQLGTWGGLKSDTSAMEGVLPGMRVEGCRVADVKQPTDGWRLAFGSASRPLSMVGEVSWCHLPSLDKVVSAPSADRAFVCVVLWVDLDRRAVGLSCREEVLERRMLVSLDLDTTAKGSATVVRVQPRQGVWMLLDNDKPAFAPLSYCRNEANEQLETVFLAGKEVPYRYGG